MTVKKTTETSVSGSDKGKQHDARPGQPDNSLPGEGTRPDNSLPPGSPPRPDNTLPGGPDNTLPGGPPPRPDNTLPGDQPGIDNSLPPGSPPRPDNTLPGDQPGIDNSLPPGERPVDPGYGVSGDRPDNSLPPGERPVDPGYGVGEGGRPDNTLPGDLPQIDNELPPVDPDDILDDIAHAEKLEVVYCDGNGPIGIPALKITKSDLKMTSNGLKLEQQEVLIFGPGREQRAYELAGYALIGDGKQLAYAKRPEPLTIGNGMTMNVAEDIVFPVAERDRDRDDDDTKRRK